MSNATTKTTAQPSAGALRAADQILDADLVRFERDHIAIAIDAETHCADLIAALEDILDGYSRQNGTRLFARQADLAVAALKKARG